MLIIISRSRQLILYEVGDKNCSTMALNNSTLCYETAKSEVPKISS